MAAPIPSAYTTGFNNGYPMLYVVRLNPTGGSPMYLVNQQSIIDVGLPRGISYGATTPTNADLYLDSLAAEVNGSEVDGIGEMDFNFRMDELGGMTGRNECVIRLLNQEFLSDTFMQYDIDNTDIEVWQGYLKPTGTIAIKTDMLLLFKGVIYEWDTWDHNLITLKCFDDRGLFGKFPDRVVNHSSFASAPESSINEGIPYLFGDFSTANTTTYGTYTRSVYEVAHPEIDVAPAVLTHAGNYQLYVHDGDWTYGGSDRTFHISKDRDWVGVLDATNISVAADSYSAEYVLIGADAYGTAYIKPAQKGRTFSGTIDANNIGSLFDNNYTNLVTVLEAESLGLTFNDFEEPGAFINGAHYLGFGASKDMKIQVVLWSVTGNVRMFVKPRSTNTLSAALTHTGGSTNMAVGLNTFEYDMATETWDGMKDLELIITPQAGANCTIQAWWVEARYFPKVNSVKKVTVSTQTGNILGQYYSAKKVVQTQLITRADSSLYFSGKGAKYGSWISDGGRSVGFASGDFIEQPAYVIEYILRNVMGVVSAEIDMSSFDTVGNTTTGTRKDWKLAASIGASQSSVEYLKQICREFGLILYQDPDDASGYLRWRLKSLPTQSTAITLAITEAMIHTDEQTQLPSLFYAQMTPQTQIKNDIYLNYKKNYATDKYDRGVYISNIHADGTMSTNLTTGTGALRNSTYVAWMEESESKYAITNAVTYDLDFIREAVTANAACKLLADWFAFRRVKLALNLIRNLSTLSLRIGDVVTVTTSLLGLNHSGTSHFMITRMNYPGVSFKCPPYITLEMEEIPSAITGSRVTSRLFDSYSIVTSVS